MRLDRLDPYLARFGSKAVAVDTGVGGGGPGDAGPAGVWLRLERSAFYPTAGGQPHDTGTIGPWRVEDVAEVAGVIWHRLAPAAAGEPAVEDRLLAEAEAAVAEGRQLDCRLDWRRRFRHMQRHTAEHLLAQTFTRVGPGYHAQAVSMRGPDCTIDLTGAPDAAALAEAEAEANRVARESLPVMAFEIEDTRLGDYALRRPTKRTGSIRLVAIGDYDVIACGGTHLRSTAEALPIRIMDSDRIKGDLTRVTFRAGEEAFEDLAARAGVTQELTRLLSAPLERQVERVTRLLADADELRRVLAARSGSAAASLAASLVAQAAELGSGRVVSHVLDGGETALFEPLIEELQRAEGVVSLLAASEDGRVRLAFLAGPGVSVDVRPALQASLARVGGRGGGRPDRAQGAGSGEPAAVAAALAAALPLLSSAR